MKKNNHLLLNTVTTGEIAIEKANMEVIGPILNRLSKPKSLIRYVTDGPGHDRRNTIDAGRIITELDGPMLSPATIRNTMNQCAKTADEPQKSNLLR